MTNCYDSIPCYHIFRKAFCIITKSELIWENTFMKCLSFKWILINHFEQVLQVWFVWYIFISIKTIWLVNFFAKMQDFQFLNWLLDPVSKMIIHKGGFFQKVRFVFQNSKSQKKKILQITILNLKFEIPAHT